METEGGFCRVDEQTCTRQRSAHTQSSEIGAAFTRANVPAVRMVCIYSHEDRCLHRKLEIRLKPLQREGLIFAWDDRDIGPGEDWEKQIAEKLDQADIILPLISPDF